MLGEIEASYITTTSSRNIIGIILPILSIFVELSHHFLQYFVAIDTVLLTLWWLIKEVFYSPVTLWSVRNNYLSWYMASYIEAKR